MCLEEQVFYKIISGLHTSISSHLSRLYKNITKVALWANEEDDNYYFNHVEYQNRVLF
jgi:mevalonate pyrophosphate decarboxylase